MIMLVILTYSPLSCPITLQTVTVQTLLLFEVTLHTIQKL
jgi:hypothetical protein